MYTEPSSTMPPRIGIAIADFGKYTPAAHDPNGELLKLGLQGSAYLMTSEGAEGEERDRLLERCLQLRMRERAGWLAVRTPEHPAGDMLGAAKAAGAISTVYLKLLNVEQAREWSVRALAECPLDAKEVRGYIEYNLGVIDSVAKTLHVDRRVRVHGLAKSPQYNGCCGRVLRHDGPRLQVLCDAEDGGQQRLLSVRPENVTFL